MPARMFLGSYDIARVMGVSQREGQRIINTFEMRGKAIKRGRRMLIDVRVLTQHLCEQDGADPVQRRKDILEVVREIDRERRSATTTNEGGDKIA